MAHSGELKIGDVTVEVLGFQGMEGHLFALVDPTKRPRGPVNDGYYPWPDFGYVWLREDGGRWVASGKISARLVSDRRADVDRILCFIADELLALNEQLASCVEVVEVRVTQVFSGEEGDLTFEGPGGTHWGMPVPSP